MLDVLMTLGHNSSCIVLQNSKLIAGYEQERLDKIKSSSAFPREAFWECMKHVDVSLNSEINLYLTHWYDDFDFRKEYSPRHAKHFNYEFIEKLKKLCDGNLNIYSLDKDFTHHDAHASSVLAFYNSFRNYQGYTTKWDKILDDKGHILVADGFGNRQEVISVYKHGRIGKGYELIDRVYGYKNSLGLLYQYATSYCGMKENQDEYKFLGYESYITSLDIHVENVSYAARRFTDKMFSQEENKNSTIVIDKNFVNTEALEEARKYFYSVFDAVCDVVGVIVYDAKHKTPEYYKRVVIGHFIQCVIEEYHRLLIEKYNIKNVLLAGGLYYNVKLNNFIQKHIRGSICINPLAGDQGCAIGLYAQYTGNHAFPFKDLFWGHRDYSDFSQYLNSIETSKPKLNKVGEALKVKNLLVIDDEEEFIESVASLVRMGKIVNITHGSMEYGPRALGNTCTLAIPTSKNAEIINVLNGRDNVMPFAPAILEKNLDYFFLKEDYERTIGSDNFMILTYDYKASVPYDEYSGIMHPYPLDPGTFSGRPQVVRDKNSILHKILEKVEEKSGIKALVLTSLNKHGVPIVFDIKDVLDTFKFQLEVAEKENLEKPILVMLTK